MDSQEIRQRFLKFFESRGHKIVPSSSLVPADPSVLLTTAGMQQFKPYFTGQKDPMADFGSKNTVSIQKSFRTSDIEAVGDDSHLTFFEMLGNFSFGGYFKEDAIKYAYEFITQEMGLKIDYISVFEGDTEVPADTESERIWKLLGISNIKKCGRQDNFWGPTGLEGPCGPTTEIYVDGVEIWNLVFNEYYCKTRTGADLTRNNAEKILEPLKIKGVDTGMGLERLAVAVQKKNNIFETDLFEPIISKLPVGFEERRKRIIADHIKASIFLIADGVAPSKTGHGYILRRLLRRARYYYDSIGAQDKALRIFTEYVVPIYKGVYPELLERKNKIIDVITLEETTFITHLGFGKKLLEKIITKDKYISGDNAFLLYSTYGFPFELILDIAKENNIEVDIDNFNIKKTVHQEISRAGAVKKFGGHGIVEGDLTASNAAEMEIKTRLHTATHLLNAALRKVLGDVVSQRGSDITAERARFDFVFNRKMTPEEIKQVEDLVNNKIKENLPVKTEEMALEKAKAIGAAGVFDSKYGERVKVYSIGDFSKEICGGPHVSNTGEIGKFRIIKEEASSAGVRRIRAIVE